MFNIFKKPNQKKSDYKSTKLTYQIDNAEQLLTACNQYQKSISDIVYENEKCWSVNEDIKSKMLNIWAIMRDCMAKGCQTEGVLPGGLNVTRRAAELNNKLLANKKYKNIKTIVNTFISTKFEKGRHLTRVKKLDK